MYNYTADKSPKHPVILPLLQRNSHMFAPFFIYFDMKKMFRNGGLNPFQKHHCQTHISL